MARDRVFAGSYVALAIEAHFGKRGVGVQPIGRKVEIVIDEERAGISVIAYAVSSNPWVYKGERNDKQSHEPRQKGARLPMSVLVGRHAEVQEILLRSETIIA